MARTRVCKCHRLQLMLNILLNGIFAGKNYTIFLHSSTHTNNHELIFWEPILHQLHSNFDGFNSLLRQEFGNFVLESCLFYNWTFLRTIFLFVCFHKKYFISYSANAFSFQMFSDFRLVQNLRLFLISTFFFFF